MDNGEEVTFEYTGGMQSFTIPHNGLYKLECWGGGNENNAYDSSGVAWGGYVSGYKQFKKGQIVYICVGGSTGYNGGGGGTSYHNPVWAYVSGNNGSGATHMAKVSGRLAEIGETSFVTNGNGYLIAGGAGGCATYAIASGDTFGRRGGNGGTGGDNGKFGYGNDAPSREDDHGAGGGGGYRGGVASGSSGSGVPSSGGSGGSNWVGGVPSIIYKGTTYSPTSTAGAGSRGNGSAKITLIKKGSSVKFGDNDVTIYYGNNEVDVYYGDNEL